MKQLLLISLLFGTVLTATTLGQITDISNVPGKVSDDEGRDKAGVLKLVEGFRIALFKGDARAFADLFTEDADFTNVIDQLIHGRENIYLHHITVFKGRPATRTNNLLSYRVRFLKNDVATVEIKWDNKHSPGPDGKTIPDRDGVWVASITKEKGQWYFKVVRNVMLNDGTNHVPKT